MNKVPTDNRNSGDQQRRQEYPRPRTAPGGQRPPSGQRPANGQRPPNVQRPSGAPNPRGTRQVPPPRRPEPKTVPIGYRPSSRKASNDKLLWILAIEVIVLIALIITFIAVKTTGDRPEKPKETPVTTEPSVPVGPSSPSDVDNPGNLPDWYSQPSNLKAFVPKSSDSTAYAENLNSEYAILVSLSDNNVIASKKADHKMYPASMTKIMTVIVACENITNMNDTFTITKEIRYPLDNMGASVARFLLDEPVSLIDLIYGAWLPSGADATAALAIKIAGSEEEFVKMMNAKAAAIGCTNTHFTNASGLHDANHYSTARDIATIMAYAVNNPFIKQVMCSRTYEPAAGLQDDVTKFTATWNKNLPANFNFFMGAKTGYETEAGSCMASLVKGNNGKEYVIVTGKASYPGGENTFNDVKTLYDSYIK